MYQDKNIKDDKIDINTVGVTEREIPLFTPHIVSSDFPYFHSLKPRQLVLSHEAQLRLDLKVPHRLTNERSGELGMEIYNNIQCEGLRPLPRSVGKPYKLIHLDEGELLDIERSYVTFQATLHCLSGCVSVTSVDGKYEETVVLSAESDVGVAPGVSIRLQSVGAWAEVLLLEVGSQFAHDDEP